MAKLNPDLITKKKLKSLITSAEAKVELLYTNLKAVGHDLQAIYDNVDASNREFRRLLDEAERMKAAAYQYFADCINRRTAAEEKRDHLMSEHSKAKNDLDELKRLWWSEQNMSDAH